eukprot:3250953-Pyramimonas_sp.AAC.1
MEWAVAYRADCPSSAADGALHIRPRRQQWVGDVCQSVRMRSTFGNHHIKLLPNRPGERAGRIEIIEENRCVLQSEL